MILKGYQTMGNGTKAQAQGTRLPESDVEAIYMERTIYRRAGYGLYRSWRVSICRLTGISMERWKYGQQKEQKKKGNMRFHGRNSFSAIFLIITWNESLERCFWAFSCPF